MKETIISSTLPLTYIGKITQRQLESNLWGAADILRGKVDAADFKHYIFGLLFFKRLCDVWSEEYEERLAQYGDAEVAADPDEHRFHIPKGCFWEDVRKHSTNIGEHLNAAFRAIEDANVRLRGVFQDVDFNNKERFPDATLELLLQHFSRHRLRNSDVEADVLGNAYEYLIAKFADDAGKKGGEFYTPKMVVRLIVECLQPEEGMSIYDPTCGSGGMLLETVHYLERQGKNAKSLHLYDFKESDRHTAIDAAFVSWQRDRALQDTKRFVKSYARELDIEPSTVRVSEQKHTWGTCGKDGIIRIDWQLIQAPVAAMEYVVAHEVVHLLHRHHGDAFWETLGSVMPDWRERKALLESWEFATVPGIQI